MNISRVNATPSLKTSGRQFVCPVIKYINIPGKTYGFANEGTNCTPLKGTPRIVFLDLFSTPLLLSPSPSPSPSLSLSQQKKLDK